MRSNNHGRNPLRNEHTLANGRFIQEYKKSAVNGASPLELIVMLYDGAIRCMQAGKEAMGNRDFEKQNAHLQRAQKIVTELMACLDMDQGKEIATNLLAIYSYALNELVQANVSADPVPVERCLRIFRELRGTWVSLEQARKSNDGADSIAA